MMKKRFDKQAQESGKWFEYDGSKFLLASAKSKAFQKAYSEVQTDAEDAEDKVAEAISAVVMDWENMLDEDGITPLAFDKKELKEILQDDVEFSQWVMATIINQDNYKREALQVKAKK